MVKIEAYERFPKVFVTLLALASLSESMKKEDIVVGDLKAVSRRNVFHQVIRFPLYVTRNKLFDDVSGL